MSILQRLEQDDTDRIEYMRSLGHDPLAERQRFARAVREYLQRWSKGKEIEEGVVEILEIGTGRGFFLAFLTSEIPHSHITSVDISEEQIERARDVLCKAGIDTGSGMENEITFVIADAGNLHFADGVFHAVVSYVSMHHMENPAVVVKEMRRAAGKDGIVAIADYTQNGLEMLTKAREHFGHDGGHGHREIPVEALEETIRESFANEAVEIEVIRDMVLSYIFIR